MAVLPYRPAGSSGEPTPLASPNLPGTPEASRGERAAPPGPLGCGTSNTATESQVREWTGVSIDWLSVYQVHEKAPLLGETLLLFCDLETGEIRSQAVRGVQHRGSFDSSLQIRCDGRRVEVSGNPSRWGRRDNVFGLSSMAACIELYNSVLRQLGLPEFSEDERPYVAPFQFQRSDSVLAAGAVVTRVDLCRNWSAGSAGSARSVLAALSSLVRQGKCAWLSPDGNTAAWGVGSRYAYVKYYLKGPELRKHAKSGDEYLQQLTAWATDSGLVRQELSAKAMMLKRKGLDRPGAWTLAKINELLDEYTPHRSAGASCSSFDELYETLRALDVPASRARAAQTALHAYLNGYKFVPGQNISKSAFYRLRADVKVAGVDIASPLNVSTLPIRVRELELSPAAAPEWYRWAG